MKLYFCENETAEGIEESYLFETEYGHVVSENGLSCEVYFSMESFMEMEEFNLSVGNMQITRVL